MSFRDRLIGLMGRRNLDNIRMLFPNCSQVHTCFMLGPIDLVFLDIERRVVHVRERVEPWRFISGGSDCRAVMELPPGFVKKIGIEVGDVIEWR